LSESSSDAAEFPQPVRVSAAAAMSAMPALSLRGVEDLAMVVSPFRGFGIPEMSYNLETSYNSLISWKSTVDLSDV
jgi:hypothetical protein